MKKVITTEKLPIKLWLDDIEKEAMVQIKNIANLPFSFKHVAIMPDCHMGYGMPIGGVLATNDMVIPNAVGVDIGCGMCAVKTSLKLIDHGSLSRIIAETKNIIPVGFKHQKKSQNKSLMPERTGEMKIVNQEYQSALHQLGTLGGGNHFIEIQKGSDGHIWIMVHSGSRNIGLKVANYYNKLAADLNEKWQSKVPRKLQLAYLPTDSKEGNIYLSEMRYCIDFAFSSRKLMMDRVIGIFHEVIPGDFKTEPLINIAHNYASLEQHFNNMVMVHRKGATQAKKGQLGIIPGSQGTNSYIVMGKGNKESFESCSHGAGRILGRKQAQKKLDLKKEIEFLNKKNIIHSIRGTRDLDEAPSAYKKIEEVMQNQTDLVDIMVELTPLAVIKG